MAVVASTTGSYPPLDLESLAEDAQRALGALGSVDWELSLLLCDDGFIRPLNAQWRDKDSATDVLSFPQLVVKTPGHPPVDQGTLLGDLVISVTTSDRQAAELGHDREVELRVLLAHGLAHLVGHTHDTPAQRAAMAGLERKLLAAMGLDDTSLVERSEAPIQVSFGIGE